MITFVCFVLWTLDAPWWVYVLSIIGIICEFDTSNLAHRSDLKIEEDLRNDRNYF